MLFDTNQQNPVLNRKIEQAHEAMKLLDEGESVTFDYKNTTWVFVVVGVVDGEPIFTLDIEDRNDYGF